MARDLDILIPARNEMFLAKTIESILENIEADTGVIAVLDGQWADPPIKQDPRVTVIYVPESIGQRAATNMACKLSKAKYVAKTDAHCAFAKGFDRVLLEDMHDDWTVVPAMRNLHAFDWVCEDGHRRYQGKSGPCTVCKKPTTRDIVWRGKSNPTSTAYRFDNTLHFQYFQEWKNKTRHEQISETMSLQGSFFMMTREKYWELNICDEKHGSWGQQGVEVACKTWLSGGKVMCNKKTWYAHMFRTQGGDFGFPYPNNSVGQARAYSRDLWINNKWPLAKHSLQWLVDRFKPVPGWHTKSKGVIYYTDNRLDPKILKVCQDNLLTAVQDLPIISVSLEPMDFGNNIVLPLQRGPLTLFKQILTALESIGTDIVFFCEHDVLYHPSHFEFMPLRDDIFYYNVNVWKMRASDGFAVKVDDCRQLSGMAVNREFAIKHYKERIRKVEEHGYSMKMGFEPGTNRRPERVDDTKSETWTSRYPNVDIRHDKNMTPTRWSPTEFRNKRYTKGWTESKEIPGWKGVNESLK